MKISRVWQRHRVSVIKSCGVDAQSAVLSKGSRGPDERERGTDTILGPY